MSDWQTDVGADPTGVLTTAQRAALARAYAARVEEEGPAPVYETVAEARQSEAGLSGEERRALQRAMQWAGVYDAAIDGAFGRGTRAAMGDWQARKGYDVTGVLTTRQRDELMADYNAILEGLGLDLVRDDTAGIEMRMPTALVEFSRYEPPFAHYDAIEDGAAYRVLLISQDGDGDTLAGLYDVMQTLEIVPQDGPRDRDDTVFRLEGQNADFVSHTEAGLVDGSVKGFTLIWPRGDEERRARVLDEMRQSFAPIPGVVMPDRVGAPDETQRVDLLAGLQIRRPELSRSGFYVDAAGMVLTTSDILGSCGRITLDEAVEAEIAAQDDASGLALLRPQSPLSPSDYARLQTATPRLQSEVAVSGFSYEGVLGAPSLTFGRLADLRGLDGADTVRRLEVGTQPGDAGGPVLDATGAVLGMLLPRNEDGGRVLPDGVSFAADSDTIAAFLGREGVQVSEAEDRSTLNPDQLGRKAGGMTVLVSCWD
ncbi:peptidoglycan-binding protein [Mesobaculum littorinae]|uniref:Peptidoglycan-binding protein n=2 Tax=Mesobaculum littorinae TaxID=2486419 RepID=A0A438AKE7_9RHOB|nr:peptidoglycan-binding protein [Mesobaculum littorinae]